MLYNDDMNKGGGVNQCPIFSVTRGISVMKAFKHRGRDRPGMLGDCHWVNNCYNGTHP
jgi:hypothetical protein